MDIHCSLNQQQAGYILFWYNWRLPLIIRLDIKQLADTCSRKRPISFTFKCPMEKDLYMFHTYAVQNMKCNELSRLQIVPHARSPWSTLIWSKNKKYLQMAKQIHIFGLSSAKYMQLLKKPRGYNAENISNAFVKVQRACPICARIETPTDITKDSTTHIN